ncbi:response regulator transcription factor [Actinophytocola sp.]|uniref:response regulator n=1 Tax=Actinophytocola sp. TaxID=1872138 RepID=UPI0025B83953|nr:response regulator transcription factor [Actinophytocola sp.]
MRVILAEDSTLLREGLVRLLAEEGHDVVASVGDADELVAAVELDRPDVVVTDVRMPPTHTDEGLRAALTVRNRWPEVGVLVLSQYVEKRYAAELISGDSGRVGYLGARPCLADLGSWYSRPAVPWPRCRKARIQPGMSGLPPPCQEPAGSRIPSTKIHETRPGHVSRILDRGIRAQLSPGRVVGRPEYNPV